MEAGTKSILEQVEDTFFEKLHLGGVLEMEIINSLKQLCKEGELINKEKLMAVLHNDIN